MNSFSIQQYQYEYEHQSVMDSYKQWLARDLYANLFTDKVDDPVFLQKLSFFQAEGIRHDIACHAAVTHSSIQNASKQVGQKIQSAAALISSSLDDGFSLMNNRMVEVNNNLGLIGQGVNAVNETLRYGNQILSNIDKGIGTIAVGMQVLSSNIAQAASVIRFSLLQMHGTLKLILDELRIPESQRERRYHIEEGMKYFSKGMKSGNCLYFEDALDEFSKATSIERKDFFSWYYIGMIHLYSKDHLDIDKASSAFDRYIHYADALQERHNLFDEALMMKAECYYLKQDAEQAYKLIEELIPVNDKAALRAMKYLSVSENTKKQAVEILKQLMQKNPYIVMQVLEDYDLINNPHLIQYIQDYKKKLHKDFSELILTAKKELESTEIASINTQLQKLEEKNKEDSRGIVDELHDLEEIQLIIGKIRKLRTIQLSPYSDYSKYGYKDSVTNEIIISGKWKKVGEFFSGLAPVQDFNNEWGYIDKTGKVIIANQWQSANDFFGGLAKVEDFKNKKGIIDKTGNFITPCQWDYISILGEGFFKVKDSNNKWGIIDKTGNFITPCKWKDIGDINFLIAVKDFYSERWGFIDKNNRLVVPCLWISYSDINFVEGRRPVSDSNGKWGYVDAKGCLILQCQWQKAQIFCEGLASVQDFNGKWGYIDRNGCLVIPCQWKKANNFHKGLAKVKDFNGKKWLIDKNGNKVKSVFF